ncbi:STAS domain-containing protein [Phytomonospora sp. NPDC050363]|uniref:STAS domain-containing protein n=1 Tax=Phytomonospora sp. NPDC050363 TaxID=3155642 RepID=UPI00340B1841
MLLTITPAVHADRVEIRLEGELDVATSNCLHTRLVELTETVSPPRIVLDLTALAFCDSTGLGVLVTAAHRCAAADGWLRLDHPNHDVAHLLTITGLTGLTGLTAEEHEPRSTQLIQHI